MDKRLVGLVGLSLLIVLAGCSGAGGPQSPSTSSKSTPQNGMNQPEATFGNVQFPSGAAATSINETQVLSGHQSVLTNRDYRLGINLTHAVSGQVANTTTIIASNKSRHRLYLQSYLPGRSLQEYYTANRSLSRTIVGDNISRTVNETGSLEAVQKRQAQPGDLLTTLLATSNFTAVNTTTIDGYDAVIYNVTDVSASNSSRLPPTIEQFNGSMTIDERGVIWEAALLTVGTRDGTVEAMFQEYQIISYGSVHVGKPEWARNQTQN
jgi:hypothetical protein